jgi:thioredoxin
MIMKTIQLNAEMFKKDIFDYTTEKEWKYKGSVPAMIDFYADWCGPCQMIAPVLEEFAAEYGDKLTIYKVNTEVEQELSALFQIRSIPSMFFIPLDKQPIMQAGALPKPQLKEVIERELMAVV